MQNEENTEKEPILEKLLLLILQIFKYKNQFITFGNVFKNKSYNKIIIGMDK